MVVGDDPLTYDEAIRYTHWQEAMREEFESLKRLVLGDMRERQTK